MVHGKDTEMMVSVIMITYGHEKYIEEAINGVFIQQTDFPVELIIANDCSPDQTDEVVKSLVSRAPENITVRYTKHQTNKGMNANFLWAASQATGKYIALCEGDDYWTDPLKLQKQVDFLENNSDYNICFSNAEIIHNNNTKNRKPFSKIENREYSQVEVYSKWIVATASIVFKEEIIRDQKFKDIYKNKDILFTDNLLLVWAGEKGKIRGMSDFFAVYRKQGDGATSAMSSEVLEKINRQNLFFARTFPQLYDSSKTLIIDRSFMNLKAAILTLKPTKIIKYVYLYLKYRIIFSKNFSC